MLLAMALPLGNLFGFDPQNWLLVGLVALLFFGRRLPEVGRSLGKGIVEFKKGLQGIGDEVNEAGQAMPTAAPMIQARPMMTQTPLMPLTPPATASQPAGTEQFKFDPYTGKPIVALAPEMKFDPYTGKPLASDSEGAAQA